MLVNSVFLVSGPRCITKNYVFQHARPGQQLGNVVFQTPELTCTHKNIVFHARTRCRYENIMFFKKLFVLGRSKKTLFFGFIANGHIPYENVVFHARESGWQTRKRVFTLEPAFMTQKMSFLSLPKYGRSPTNELSGLLTNSVKASFL